MIFNSRVKFLSSEEKVSGKGNKYTISSFMQSGGADVLMVMDTSKGLNLQFGQDVEGIFDYSPKFGKMTFVGITIAAIDQVAATK